jgi:REP element-mobilizing transposase RayT
MKFTTAPLIPGECYHIYNRGNNHENLFIEKRNYPYFLSLYTKHIHPIADTYAYCLLKNHFHISLRIKTEEEYYTSQVLETYDVPSKKKILNPSQSFSNFFNAYAKAINKGYGRSGSLFEERFGRIPVRNDSYFATLIFYIHYNPQKHGFVDDFHAWEWSSYHALTGTGETKLHRAKVLDMFGGAQEFEHFHQGRLDEKKLAALIDDEFEVETQV